MEKAQNIYDNQEFYNEYIAMRKTGINANELLEIPIMKELLPDLTNKTILDLGCGYGDMSKYFIEKGAKKVVACDISQNMLNLAKQVNKHKNIDYKILPMEKLSSLHQTFDIVYSSLAFHYVKDFDKLIKDIYNHLNPNGILIFSQEHPLVTALKSKDKKRIEIEGKLYFLLSDYNMEGERRINWNVPDVVKFHRNFKTVINTLSQNNFQIICIDESYARKEAVEKVEKYIYQNDRPYFLFVKAKKN